MISPGIGAIGEYTKDDTGSWLADNWLFASVPTASRATKRPRVRALSSRLCKVSPSPPAQLSFVPKPFKHFGTMFYANLCVANDIQSRRILREICRCVTLRAAYRH